MQLLDLGFNIRSTTYLLYKKSTLCTFMECCGFGCRPLYEALWCILYLHDGRNLFASCYPAIKRHKSIDSVAQAYLTD